MPIYFKDSRTSPLGPHLVAPGAAIHYEHRAKVAHMANNNEVAYTDTLWKSADTLRGQVDAAEYKHVVLGLLFLKYISDSFEARREELKAELVAEGITGAQQEALLENRDEYTAERVFWVPPEARWVNL